MRGNTPSTIGNNVQSPVESRSALTLRHSQADGSLPGFLAHPFGRIAGIRRRVPCLIQVGRRLSAEGGSDIDVTAELEKARNTMTNRRIEQSSVFSTPAPRDRVEEI